MRARGASARSRCRLRPRATRRTSPRPSRSGAASGPALAYCTRRVRPRRAGLRPAPPRFSSTSTACSLPSSTGRRKRACRRRPGGSSPPRRPRTGSLRASRAGLAARAGDRRRRERALRRQTRPRARARGPRLGGSRSTRSIATDWPDLELKPLTAAFHYRRAPARPRRTHSRGSPRRHLPRASARSGDASCSRWCRRSTCRRERRSERCSRSSGLRRALYAGDDVTDLDGFRALDGLEVAVRVAVSRPKARRSSASRRCDRLPGSVPRAVGGGHLVVGSSRNGIRDCSKL